MNATMMRDAPRPLRIAIVDYGMGNTGSVAKAFRFFGLAPAITDDAGVLADADAIVLPGVGAFGQAMENLRARKLDTALTEFVVERGKPFLGICLGMQLIAEDSTEFGSNRGLGWIKGHVREIPEDDLFRVPHVGWSPVTPCEPGMFQRIENGASFYFDHSLHLECDHGLVVARAMHAMPVTAAVRRRNIFATQFHPEKSQRNGLKVLRNFLNYAEGSL